ncbi:hypothetical protein FR008_24715, partial [Salmonella enterica]|nr:hypothetical protein [Salmonella enterica]
MAREVPEGPEVLVVKGVWVVQAGRALRVGWVPPGCTVLRAETVLPGAMPAVAASSSTRGISPQLPWRWAGPGGMRPGLLMVQMVEMVV